MQAEAEDKSASGGRLAVAENEETGRCECQTSDREASDQRREPVERGRVAAVLPDDDWCDGVARIDRVRHGAAIGSAGDDRRLRRSARREAVTPIVGSQCGCRALNVGAVRQETAVRSPGRAVCCRADARAAESDEHAENERNPVHVELLRFGPLGAADQETVAPSRRNEGNTGCKAAASKTKSPANQHVVISFDRDSVG